MGGTFVDATAGFTNFNRAFSSNRRDETFAYLSFVKPFVSRYLKWTYGINAELHNTERLYKTDTVYRLEHRYRYHLFDTWAVWNMDASKSNRFLTGDDRYQKLIGIRVLETQFTAKPDRFLTEQYFRYNNVRAVLADISVYKQDFYKIKYIYGFGRNEDVPEGVNTSVTVGYTQINERGRPYAAFNYQRNYFTDTKQYFNYTLRTGFYKYRSKLEDVNILGSIDYITRLVQLSNSWKQRIFLSASVASQIRSVYNEPLVLESDYGLQDFNNNGQGAKSRVSMRGEAVFYSPISVAFFKFAPFAFANTSFLNLKSAVKANDQKIYSALGGGLRIRNESLIFGTMELKGIYFPRKNFFGDQWRFEFGTNIRFKYNRELIRRPEFVVIN
jgi:hypothetical protein